MDTRHYIALLYGSISMFSAVLHNIFILYHIDMFLSVFRIDKASFWVGETLFLIWNSVNDPLFGWLGDNASTVSRVHQKSDQADTEREQFGSESSESRVIRRNKTAQHSDTTYDYNYYSTLPHSFGASHHIIASRTKSLMVFGPLMAASFILLLFDWQLPLLQFVVCLCLYDSFLTIVDLQHSALLAELSVDSHTRTLLNTYQSVFSAVGATSVFLSYALWDKTNLYPFRLFCVTIALLAGLGFYIVSSYLTKFCTAERADADILITVRTTPSTNSSTPNTEKPSYLRFLRQVCYRRNFLIFSLVNLIQVFHCHFNSNFFPLFLEALVDVHVHGGSFLIGISFVLPHINNIFFLMLSKRYGVYNVIRGLFSAKLLMSLLMWYYGISYGWLLYLFIACNRIFTEGTCRLMSLVIADLVDEDFVKSDRSEPISALMFGTANFLAKPGQTLAPVVGTSLISAIAGFDLFSQTPNNELDSFRIEDMQPTEADVYRHACFSVLVYVPIFCAIAQWLLWSFYKLHGARLDKIRQIRSNLHLLISV